jgi:hypothetical protein
MFIGHFAAGFAAKKFAPKANLGVSFMACQLLDLIWPVLVLLGVEKVIVDFETTAVTPFDFIHYPYSHSLLMTVVYSTLMFFICTKIFKSKKVGLTLALLVASHWVLDVISHRPDMPLAFGDIKVGLGLWHSKLATLFIESLLFAGGAYLYWKARPDLSERKKNMFFVLLGFLYTMYLINLFGPKPSIDTPAAGIAVPALAMWLLVWWGWWIDDKGQSA